MTSHEWGSHLLALPLVQALPQHQSQCESENDCPRRPSFELMQLLSDCSVLQPVLLVDQPAGELSLCTEIIYPTTTLLLPCMGMWKEGGWSWNGLLARGMRMWERGGVCNDQCIISGES